MNVGHYEIKLNEDSFIPLNKITFNINIFIRCNEHGEVDHRIRSSVHILPNNNSNLIKLNPSEEEDYIETINGVFYRRFEYTVSDVTYLSARDIAIHTVTSVIDTINSIIKNNKEDKEKQGFSVDLYSLYSDE